MSRSSFNQVKQTLKQTKFTINTQPKKSLSQSLLKLRARRNQSLQRQRWKLWIKIHLNTHHFEVFIIIKISHGFCLFYPRIPNHYHITKKILPTLGKDSLWMWTMCPSCSIEMLQDTCWYTLSTSDAIVMYSFSSWNVPTVTLSW